MRNQSRIRPSVTTAIGIAIAFGAGSFAHSQPAAPSGPAPTHADIEYAPAEPADSKGHLLDIDLPELEGDVGVTGVSSAVRAAAAFYPPTDFLRMDRWAVRPCTPGASVPFREFVLVI